MDNDDLIPRIQTTMALTMGQMRIIDRTLQLIKRMISINGDIVEQGLTGEPQKLQLVQD